MCEFNIIIKNEIVLKDVVHVKTEDNKVTARSILGETKVFKNCKITEVDVNSTKLVLTETED